MMTWCDSLGVGVSEVGGDEVGLQRAAGGGHHAHVDGLLVRPPGGAFHCYH